MQNIVIIANASCQTGAYTTADIHFNFQNIAFRSYDFDHCRNCSNRVQLTIFFYLDRSCMRVFSCVHVPTLFLTWFR